jgi:hypothetical protein
MFGFDYLWQLVHLSTSPFKYVAFSYLHANVIDIVGTIIITASIIRGLIKTHVEFINKGFFYI